jgi:hypothetical protein
MAEVNVIYDFENKTIAVDVLVEEDINGRLKVTAALPVLQPGSWEVTWILQAGTNVSDPTFDQADGIEITESPSNLTPGPLVPGPTGSTQTISFMNTCDSANLARYDIRGSALVTGERKSFRKDLETVVKFIHDPTISVVTDPPTS